MKKHALRLAIGLAVMAALCAAAVALVVVGVVAVASLRRWPIHIAWAFLGVNGLLLAYAAGTVVTIERRTK